MNVKVKIFRRITIPKLKVSKSSVNNIAVLSLFLLLFVFSFVFYLKGSIIGHIKYALPILGLVLFAFYYSKKPFPLQRNYVFNFIILYTVIIFFSFIVALFNLTISARFFAEAIFLLTPLLLLFVLFYFYDPKKKQLYINVIFWGIIIAFFLLKGKVFLQTITNPQQLLFSIITSTIKTESGMVSFTMGLFTLYFFIEKSWKKALIAFVMTVISFKRVALLGVFVAIGFYFIIKILKINVRKYGVAIAALASIVNLAFVVLIFLFTNGFFDELFYEFNTHPNYITQGRYALYNLFLDEIQLNPVFGVGLGTVTPTLISAKAHLNNLHSDIFKNFVELGIVTFTIWIFFFYKLNSISTRSFILTIYMNVLFLTDNTIVYFDVMFVFFFLASISYLDKYHQSNEQKLKFYIFRPEKPDPVICSSS